MVDRLRTGLFRRHVPCISLSDLLPELQFHSHDRLMLSVALLLGLGVAHFAARMEALAHTPHSHRAIATRSFCSWSNSPAISAGFSSSAAHALPALPDRRQRRFRRVPYARHPKTRGEAPVSPTGQTIGSTPFPAPKRMPMSGTHHRTWQQYHVGHVNITVQLDSIAGGRNLEQHQNMAECDAAADRDHGDGASSGDVGRERPGPFGRNVADFEVGRGT